MCSPELKLLGSYSVPAKESIYLIEVAITQPPLDIDMSKFLIKSPNTPENDWQTAYYEHYLSEDGTKVIGDFVNRRNLHGNTSRIAFFMFIDDLSIPISTPYGNVFLIAEEKIPDRLRKIIDFSIID